ncbi:MAG: bifunctional folylpolyglutamate synthase/dihydrofolate synthase [Paludibacteraceae bacterium]|nr:bifunctional folylpolyglutamate synthase/dihydrofolate synthase [Paludibacteraceae bacterium]
MTYNKAIDYLYASTPAFHLIGQKAYKPGIDNALSLMSYLGHPERQWKSIHIAGTNGKGSTSHLIAASLQRAGLKVGLYTSPHLVDFRERIRVFTDGEPTANRQLPDSRPTVDRRSNIPLSHPCTDTRIPQEAVIRFVEENKTFLDQLHPSFFETTMAMAFWYFAQEKIDIAVIEVGLGGRLDSTNVLPPFDPITQTGVQLSVITNIGLDHTEFLGNTLAQIAGEKAGIIKSGVPCVIGETDPETMPVFIKKAGTDSTIYFADQCEYLRRCRLRDIPTCQLKGLYQEKNMQTAYVALRALGIPTPCIRDGFANVCTLTGLRGRWEILSQHPLTICDTGHNSHGIKYVAEQLQTTLQQRKTTLGTQVSLRIVFGMVSDKDVDVVMTLLPKNAVYYFTQAQTKRAIPANQLLTMFTQANCDVQQPLQPNNINHAYSSVQLALQAAQKDATDQDIIFIGGSNYVVGETLPLFN